MATTELRKRANWQTASGKKATGAEFSFFETFKHTFNGTIFTVTKKPKDFEHLYEGVDLPTSLLGQTYKPKHKYKHGLYPDFAIENTETGKKLYVEVKRQDGWIAGTNSSAGRGNVHERSCKYFTPGLRKILSEKGGLGEHVLPFWVVFMGNITRDPKRTREVTLWYLGVEDHYFFWADQSKPDSIITHFDERLKPYLLGKTPAPRVVT